MHSEAVARITAAGGEGGLDGFGVEYYTAQLFACFFSQVILGNQMVTVSVL